MPQPYGINTINAALEGSFVAAMPETVAEPDANPDPDPEPRADEGAPERPLVDDGRTRELASLEVLVVDASVVSASSRLAEFVTKGLLPVPVVGVLAPVEILSIPISTNPNTSYTRNSLIIGRHFRVSQSGPCIWTTPLIKGLLVQVLLCICTELPKEHDAVSVI